MTRSDFFFNQRQMELDLIYCRLGQVSYPMCRMWVLGQVYDPTHFNFSLTITRFIMTNYNWTYISSQYIDVKWSSWCFESPASELFLFGPWAKKISELHITGSWWNGTHSDNITMNIVLYIYRYMLWPFMVRYSPFYPCFLWFIYWH